MPAKAQDKLSSWKEIAAFLGRDVRTAQRWERECGLPVHRVPGSKGHSVYAYPEELDAWLRGVARSTAATQSPEAKSAPGASLARAGSTPAATVSPQLRAEGPRRRWRFALPAIGLAAVASLITLAVVGFDVGGWRDRLFFRASAHYIRAIAVLPFANLSGDPSQDYLSDGITEELTTTLAQVTQLQVRSKTSVLRYKGTHKPLPDIARELNVDAVVEGSVLKSGDGIRITAQLIQASLDRHLWAKTYERNLRDILAVQDDVARRISEEVRIKLTPAEQARLASSRPVNPAAYDAYLQGRYFWNKRTRPSLEKAIGYFNQAIANDPGFALAYAGLADAYVLDEFYCGHSADVLAKAKAAASKALELDESLAEAHNSLAGVKAFHEWDWPGAEREFKRAVELDPGYAPAHHWYAVAYLVPLGRYQEAIAEMQRAQALDPVSLIINTDLGWVYEIASEDDLALAQYQKTLEMDVSFVPAHFRLWQHYARCGMYKEAAAELKKDIAFNTGEEWARGVRDFQSASEFRNFLRLSADKAVEASQYRPVELYSPALIYSLLDEKNRALGLLERACVRREAAMIYLKVDPVFVNLRSDPRFQDLVRRMGLNR